MNKQNKVNKFLNIVFVFIIIFSSFVGFLYTVLFPRDINEYENRYREKMIAPTWQAFVDSSFQDSVEKSLADQIPKAQSLKRIYNETTSKYLRFLLEPTIKTDQSHYIKLKNAKFFGGSYVYNTSDMKELKPLLDAKAQNYNNLFEAYPNVEYYVYYIEKDSDINFENNQKVNAGEYLFSKLKLDGSRKATFETNSFNDFKENFYRTDHHWNHKGSYKAYLQVSDLLKCDSKPIEKGQEVIVSKEFMGSKASSAGMTMIKETFFAYDFQDLKLAVTINGQPSKDYGLQEEFLSGNCSEKIKYGTFYGGDDGEIIFDSGKIDGDNILIIGESYDNAILKLLATHFHKTHSIDLRNYEHYFGKKFDYGKYVEEHDIDKVLFIGNIDFYTMTEFELESN